MPFPGLLPKPKYELELSTSTGKRWLHQPDVPVDKVREVLTEWLAHHWGDSLIVRIDGGDFTAVVRATLGPEVARRSGRPLPPEPEDSRGPGHLDVAGAWRFLLTDDHVLHRLPFVPTGTGDTGLHCGPGPGGLSWQPIEDHGMVGLRAVHHGGMFKILRVAAERFALVYERTAGDWEALATGAPEALKERASQSAAQAKRKIDYAALLRSMGPGKK